MYLQQRRLVLTFLHFKMKSWELQNYSGIPISFQTIGGIENAVGVKHDVGLPTDQKRRSNTRTHRETLLLWAGKENEVTVGVGGGAANVFAVKILWGGGGHSEPHLGVFSKTNSDAYTFTKEIPAQVLVKLTFKGSECELSVSHFHPNPALSVFPTFPEFRDWHCQRQFCIYTVKLLGQKGNTTSFLTLK